MPRGLCRDDVRRMSEEEGAQIVEVLPREEFEAVGVKQPARSNARASENTHSRLLGE